MTQRVTSPVSSVPVISIPRDLISGRTEVNDGGRSGRSFSGVMPRAGASAWGMADESSLRAATEVKPHPHGQNGDSAVGISSWTCEGSAKSGTVISDLSCKD